MRHFWRGRQGWRNGICGLLLLTGLASYVAAEEPPAQKPSSETGQNGDWNLDEFLRDVPPAQKLAKRLEFFQRDRDENRSLSTEELSTTLTKRMLSAEAQFRYRDLNSDAKLTREEFQQTLLESTPALAKRNFVIADANEDQSLTSEEFRCLPGLLPTDLRGPFPDPVSALFQQANLQWEKAFLAADANGDRRLSRQEWQRLAFGKTLQPYQVLSWDMWDRNQDGHIDPNEGKHLLAIGFGTQDPTGTLLRQPQGVVYYGSFLRRADKSGDYVLSVDELSAAYWGGADAAKKIFLELDADRDERLTATEIMQTKPFTVDELSGFLSLDQDLDGQLTPAELLAARSTGASLRQIQQALRAFDENRDGLFSLAEYRLAPVGMGYVTLNVNYQRDLDHDGLLAWSEFYTERSPVLMGLAWHLFCRYDHDQNDLLSLDEFDFKIDATKVPAEPIFRRKDTNQDASLTLGELMEVPEPAAEKATTSARDTEQLRYWKSWLRFADSDHDQVLTLSEFQAGRLSFPEAAYQRFLAWDQNHDGSLSLEELLVAFPAIDPKLVARNFRVIDFRQTGVLTFEEFVNYPGQVAPDLRIDVPDPLAHLSISAFNLWKESLAYADTNHDGQINLQEWPDQAFPTDLAALSDVGFSTWDADQNGQITLAEAERMIDVFYGLRDVSGQSLRLPSGVVLYASFCHRADRNHDLVWTKDEFLAAYWTGQPKALELFQDMDRDANGKLSVSEIMQTRPLTVDLLASFFHWDQDLDGLISKRELAKGNSGANPLQLNQGFAAFDGDQDGKLSFLEFWATPVGGCYVTLSSLVRKDLNQDGGLCWSEFHPDHSPYLRGLAWELFRCYDRSQDGQLSPDEFQF